MSHHPIAAFRTAHSSRHFVLHTFRNALFALVLVLSAMGLYPPVTPVQAVTQFVTTTADSGPGSLRQAVLDAAPFEDIRFNLPNPSTITLLSPIVVNKELSIVGPGLSALTLSGGSKTRVFSITSGTLRLDGFTIQDGFMKGSDALGGNAGTVSGLGGAIYVAPGAGLTASNMAFDYNSAMGGKGGDAYLDPVNGYISGSGGGNGGLRSNPGPGQTGGFGGGGGSGSGTTTYAGSGGYGGGGGGNSCGGLGGAGGPYGGNGAGSTKSSCGFSAGGGGAGLGGAVFIDSGAAAGFYNTTFYFNQAQGGKGGSSLVSGLGGGGGGGGAGLGSAIFNNGSLCIRTGVSYTSNQVVGGAAGLSMAGFAETPYGQQPGQALDTSAGVFDVTHDASCDVWYYAPIDINFIATTLPENSPAGTDAGTLSAVDLDAGDTSTYTLVAGAGDNDNASFAISTNHIVTAAVLDYEAKPSYHVRVRATDSHHKYYEKAFTIYITNVNDAPTSLTLTPAQIGENLPSGLSVGSLTSSDPDSSVFTYSLQNSVAGCDGSDNTSFAINGSNLLSTVTFDYETKNAYKVCIRTTDNGTPAAYLDRAFTVSVIDVNDQPTSLDLTYAVLYENQASGTLAATLTAADPDSGDTLTYSLVIGAGSTDNALFTISGDQLLTTAPLDYETKSSYQVRVRVTDALGLFIEQTGLVPLLDVNEAPTAISLSNASVDENAATTPTPIGTLTSTDPDSAAFTYDLVSTATCAGADNARFSIVGDQLLANSAFNFETKSSYSVCVRSTDVDTSLQSFDQAFTVTINNVNETPSGMVFFYVTPPEHSPIGTSAGTLMAIDPDLGDTFTFSLVPGNGDTDNGLFTITGNLLTNAAILNYETRAQYSVRVRVTDAAGLYAEDSLLVPISDVNEAPSDISLSKSTIVEFLPPGTIIGLFSTVDADSSAFLYSLSSGGPTCSSVDNGWFVIAGNTLQSAATFNQAIKSTYTICVRSTDNGATPAYLDKQFEITITEMNQAPTSLSLSSLPLYENLAPGTHLGTLLTSDPNLGDTFTYTLVAGAGDADNALFSISGDQVFTAAVFDYEVKPDLSIRVRSTDSGGLYIEQDFPISIADLNESPEGIVLNPSSVDEDALIGSLVGSLTTTDPDAGDTFTYALVAGTGDADNAAFSLSTDQILTNAIFDHETKSSYSIRIRSTDSGSSPIEVPLTITVNDVNEAPFVVQPIANQSQIAGQPFSFTFASQTFSDPDGDALTYTARLGNGDPLPASISFDSASRTFSGTYGQAVILTIEVTASDAGGLSAAATFTLSFTPQTGNHAPILVLPIANVDAPPNVSGGFAFPSGTFVDYDNDPLSYTANLAGYSLLPPWLTFDAASRSFHYSPVPASMGVYPIEVHASDGRGGEAIATFDIGVLLDVGPSLILPIPDQAAPRGSLWQFQMPANTFVDANGDPLVWSATLANGNPLPAWLAFDTATHTFSGTPPETGQSTYIYELRVTVTDQNHKLQASDTFRFGHWLSNASSGSVPPGVQATMVDAIGSGPSVLPSNAVRWNFTVDMGLVYGQQPVTGLANAGVPICYYISLADRLNAGNDISRLAIGTSHSGGDWTLLSTTRDNNASTICATADQFSLFDVFLLPAAAEPETSTPSPLPATGFAQHPGIVLPTQPLEKAYAAYDGLTLEIPAIGVSTPIIGVPQTTDGWDVTWLGSSAGWLNGSAFPTWTGNSVITGHVWNASNTPGIFASLEDLRYGARVKIHAYGQIYTYEVRDNFIISVSGASTVFKHEDRAWVTLVTCDGYDASTGTYRWRTVVRAVLIDVSEE